jgi:hypothetical protein
MRGERERDLTMKSDDTSMGQSARTEAAEAARGDAVESAGETVAADTISGPDSTGPVGADTLVKVEERDVERKE